MLICNADDTKVLPKGATQVAQTYRATAGRLLASLRLPSDLSLSSLCSTVIGARHTNNSGDTGDRRGDQPGRAWGTNNTGDTEVRSGHRPRHKKESHRQPKPRNAKGHRCAMMKKKMHTSLPSPPRERPRHACRHARPRPRHARRHVRPQPRHARRHAWPWPRHARHHVRPQPRHARRHVRQRAS